MSGYNQTMPRNAPTPTTRLGQLMQARRGTRTGAEAATEAGVSEAAWYRWERGAHLPSLLAVRSLARFLGIPEGAVMDAATQPPQAESITQDPDTAAPGAEVPTPPAPVATVTAPAGVRDQSLALGRTVLSPWVGFAGAGLRRRSSGLGFVAVLPTDATARDLPGVKESYSDRTPGLSVEARADALDAWLMRNGAKVAPLTSKPSPS